MGDLAEHLRRTSGSVFDRTPVLFAYLYGSHARGDSGPRSDIDLAVWLESTEEDTFDLSLRIPSDLERVTGHGPISALLILNEAPIAIGGRAVQEGTLIYSRDEPARVRHASLILRQFHDFKIHEDRSTQERLARMAGEH